MTQAYFEKKNLECLTYDILITTFVILLLVAGKLNYERGDKRRAHCLDMNVERMWCFRTIIKMTHWRILSCATLKKQGVQKPCVTQEAVEVVESR